MKKYDYNEILLLDIQTWVCENDYDLRINEKDVENNEIIDNLYETLINEDFVTGNGSGSYFCDAWKAEEAICHNWDLLAEAIEEFGYKDFDIIQKGPETCDVIIRCYLLAGAIQEFVENERGGFR